ncbi:MAG: hypothetical protein ACYCW6_16605 [Candidatus Xenobia bacterium]
MPDLFAIVGALKDTGKINQTEMTELFGTNMRPQYTDVLAVLQEKGLITPEEKKTLAYPDPNKLYQHLQEKGVLA